MKLLITGQILTLCGSTRFKNEFEEWNKRLTEQENIVLSVVWFTHADRHVITEQEKQIFDKMHKRKIDLSNAIFVINPNGYIGESTRSEIDYAVQTGKKVYYMSDRGDQNV